MAPAILSSPAAKASRQVPRTASHSAFFRPFFAFSAPLGLPPFGLSRFHQSGPSASIAALWRSGAAFSDGFHAIAEFIRNYVNEPV